VRLHVVHDRHDGDARVVWLSERAEEPDFVLVLFEVHSSPGLAEMEKAVGEDLATPVVVRAEQLARERPPSLDPSPLPAMSRRSRPVARAMKRARAS